MENVAHDASATLGACEFHKKTGITDKQRELELSFKQRFVDIENGRIRKEYINNRNCPICGGNEGEVVFVKNGFDHKRCCCGMIYVPEVLKDEYLNIIYADNEFAEDTHNGFRAEPRKSFIESIYNEGLNLISAYGVAKGKLLDVGCSSGLFMEFAKNRGFVVQGIEPSQYAVDYAKKLGLDASQGYFRKRIVEGGSVDLITLWDVLEHCESPTDILNDIYYTLKPGGVLFLQVPNVMGIAPRIMRQACNMFTGFGHINLFGPETIKKVLEKCGFSDIRMQSVISEISVVNNYLNYYDPYFGPSLDRESILRLLDIKTLHEKLLGYKLQVIGKKSQ